MTTVTTQLADIESQEHAASLRLKELQIEVRNTRKPLQKNQNLLLPLQPKNEKNLNLSLHKSKLGTSHGNIWYFKSVNLQNSFSRKTKN